MRTPGVAELGALRRRYGERLTTEFVDFPDDEWTERDGGIVHRRTDFFRVVGQRDSQGVERVLFRQSERALVGLLTAVVDGERHVLLNARAEPGLHGGCQFSTTIQSTPSNYERRHGGAATPLIDMFLTPTVRVVHDSLQYDWGQYYDAKVKRFLVLEATELLAVEEPLVWVGAAALDDLMREDFAVTGDLRSAVLALDPPALDTTGVGSLPPPPDEPSGQAPADVALAELENWRMHAGGIDEIRRVQGLSVRYVTTRADSREVSEWSQPLMVVDDDLDVRLPVRPAGDGLECAVQLRSAPGLRGARLWYPAELVAPDSHPPAVPVVRASAEGGRFMRHEIRLSAVMAGADDVVEGSQWIGLSRLHGWSLADRCTSLELRLALAAVLVFSRSARS